MDTVKMSIVEPFKRIMEVYCDPNADMLDFLEADIRSGDIGSNEAEAFRKQLKQVIDEQTISPEQFKQLTGENEYTTPEALQAWLQELYSTLFPDD